MSSGTLSAHVEFDASDMVSKIATYAERLRSALLELGQIYAARIESAAKQNAIWIDRTTNARTGLKGLAVMEGGRLLIYLFHTMTYGKWLEVAMGERYAIIMATLQEFYPRIMAQAQKLVTGG